MALSAEVVAYAVDLFSGIGNVTSKRMMGGVCLYADNTIFALVRSDGVILLKGAGAMAERMEREGWEKWTYVRSNGQRGAMPYWQLPQSALDDPEEAAALAREALSALR